MDTNREKAKLKALFRPYRHPVNVAAQAKARVTWSRIPPNGPMVVVELPDHMVTVYKPQLSQVHTATQIQAALKQCQTRAKWVNEQITLINTQGEHDAI